MKCLRANFWLGTVLTAAIPLASGNVVTDWNAIASTAIVKNGGKAPQSSPVWFAYSSLAVYDAVNAITGLYQPFYYHATATRDASVDAAVAAAAHRVLVTYFPAQKTDLDAKFAASLAAITDGPAAKDAGVAVGEASAAAVIAARTGDGLEANVPYVPGSGPGVWNPTPPGLLAAATPWLAKMRPFTMTTPSQFRPDGPTPLTSEAWKRDYNLTRLYGSASSTARSKEESEIGVFWTEHTGQQYARAFAYLANNYGLTVPDTARMMAMLWVGYADAAIGCFDGKYTYSFWRPVTAIMAGGGNSELQGDASWLPLGTTPNHPEYPAGHGCVTGSVSSLIAGFFRTTNTRVVVDSLAFQDGVHTHTFTDTRDLMDEVFWARIYAGFHFYHSMEDARDLGNKVAAEVLGNYFAQQIPGRAGR